MACSSIFTLSQLGVRGTNAFQIFKPKENVTEKLSVFALHLRGRTIVIPILKGLGFMVGGDGQVHKWDEKPLVRRERKPGCCHFRTGRCWGEHFLP
jgi:hypothetical protein